MEKEKDHSSGVCAIPFFERNNYFYSKLMTVRDFFAEQRYFNEKRWLMNRMISGWGVVCGLEVTFDPRQRALIVSPGLAIDCHGREILICEPQTVKLAVLEPPCNPTPEPPEEAGERLVLCLEYHDCKTEPVQLTAMACGGEERQEFNRIRDSFKLRLRHESDVHLPPPYGRLCPLMHFKESGKPETMHGYLCRNLKEGCPDCDEKVCLVLARVVRRGESEDPERPAVFLDACFKRRLVYSNPVLYDLIHCFHGDLPHVIDISWKGVHAAEKLAWDEFAALLNNADQGLTVYFDQEMDDKTINRHTFLLSVANYDEDTGYDFKRYISPERIEYAKDAHGSHATFFVNEAWRKDTFVGTSKIQKDGGDVEIVLRGNLITNLNGQALDGDFIANKFPSGNGVQGGDFVSWFSVLPMPKPQKSQG